jgi:uncharacterized Ntn-hydrolase superfamily protein
LTETASIKTLGSETARLPAASSWLLAGQLWRPATGPAVTDAATRARRCARLARGAAYGGTLDLAIDLRVDDHRAPVDELGRLLDLHEQCFGKPEPASLLPPQVALAAQVAVSLEQLGYPTADGARLAKALDTWAGAENFEERLAPG